MLDDRKKCMTGLTLLVNFMLKITLFLKSQFKTKSCSLHLHLVLYGLVCLVGWYKSIHLYNA